MRIEDFLIHGSVILAHTAKPGTARQPETLAAHSDLVLHFMDKLAEQNGLSAAVQRAVASLTVDEKPLDSKVQCLIAKWFKQAIYLHDLGKINPFYQDTRMKNRQVLTPSLSIDYTHSLLSALLYLDIHLAELAQEEDYGDEEITGFLKQVLYVFAYVISRHHTYLGDLEKADGQKTFFEMELDRLWKKVNKNTQYIQYYKYKERLCSKNIVEEILKNWCARFNDNYSPFPFYVLTKLLYSTMVACDFYAVHAYDTGEELAFQYFGEERPLLPILDTFQNTDLYNGIQEFRKNPEKGSLSAINKLRSSLFIDTEEELLRNLDKSLYYLEAPTGSGKTNMSINLGLKLLNSGLGLNKLIYVFPFNALIEQTKQTLDEIFPAELRSQYPIQVINSITPIVKEEDIKSGKAEEEIDFDYKSILLQRQMLQYPVTLTSHVNFFNYLFGGKRESNLAFTHLCNSVVILDEIQSYKNSIWKEIIHFLQSSAKLLNMKVIVMSATLPNWDSLVEGESNTCPLVTKPELYYQHPLFRKRVKLHFELLAKYKVITEDELLDEVLQTLEERRKQGKATRLLIEFISKSAARSFYSKLQERELNIPIFELTGDDSNILRKEVLQRLGTDEGGNFFLPNAIVVATQVIEAGVNIDMDIGFKDISILDSEEQFLGRINRSCLRNDCHAYFFNMVQTTTIYRDDQRTAYDLQDKVFQKMLEDKDFSGYYRLVIDRINEERKKATMKNWAYFTSSVQKLQFREVEKTMQLIIEKHYTLFIAHQITYKNAEGIDVQLDGAQVWKDFNDLLAEKEIEYAQRMVKLSQIKEKMAYFTFNFGKQDDSHTITPHSSTETVGNLYYIPNGERFMEVDKTTGTKKFNRKAYSQFPK